MPNRLQYILAIIVSIVWALITFIPFFIPNSTQDARVIVGVQAAMMLVLGAIFGKNIIGRRNGNGNG